MVKVLCTCRKCHQSISIVHGCPVPGRLISSPTRWQHRLEDERMSIPGCQQPRSNNTSSTHAQQAQSMPLRHINLSEGVWTKLHITQCTVSHQTMNSSQLFPPSLSFAGSWLLGSLFVQGSAEKQPTRSPMLLTSSPWQCLVLFRLRLHQSAFRLRSPIKLISQLIFAPFIPAVSLSQKFFVSSVFPNVSNNIPLILFHYNALGVALHGPSPVVLTFMSHRALAMD